MSDPGFYCYHSFTATLITKSLVFTEEILIRKVYINGFFYSRSHWECNMNAMRTRMTGLPPEEAVKMSRVLLVAEKAPLPEKLLQIGTLVYIATNKEDSKEMGHRWVTDPWWTHKPYPILCRVSEPGQPMLYYAAFSMHWFNRSQLMHVSHSNSGSTESTNGLPRLFR